MLAVAIAALAVLFSGLLAPTASEAADSISVRGRVVDDQGKAVAGVNVLAVQKTWPNNQYHQQMLAATTDEQGQFIFENFAQAGKQYAFLLSVISDRWLMTSEYRVVKDGKQQAPITLTTEKAEPVTITFVAQGQPVSEVRAVPTQRTLADGSLEYLSYEDHVLNSGASSDESGEVKFASWKPGEKGAIAYIVGDKMLPFNFTAPANRQVFVAIPPAATKAAAGPPIHVSGRVVDAAGKPLAGVDVLAIRKTWPNNQYRQEALSAKTDKQGSFRFDKFATGGSQYAFMLTVLLDGYAMTSEYRLVEDGSQQAPVTLRLEQAEPVTVVLKDTQGKALEGVEVSPGERSVDASTMYVNYSMHMQATSKKSNKNGEVTFTAWKSGESGSIHYRHGERYGEIQFTVAEDRRAEITLPAE